MLYWFFVVYRYYNLPWTSNQKTFFRVGYMALSNLYGAIFKWVVSWTMGPLP